MSGLPITASTLLDDLKSFGIGKGDIVYVRASLRKIGVSEQNKAGGIFLDALLDAVGEQGTILGLAFTKVFYRPLIDREHIFTTSTPAETGAFANTMLRHPNSVRSAHPVTSFVAIGPHAHELLDRHDEESRSYLPIQRLIDLNGKMILIGWVSEGPGFTTVHLAQDVLNLTRKSILKNLLGVYYKKGSDIKLFTYRDSGGCSRGFYKFYSHYITNEKLKCGMVGEAYSISISAKEAFEIEYNLIRKNNKFPLCDDARCFICRGTWLYNWTDMITYYFKYLPHLIVKVAKHLLK